MYVKYELWETATGPMLFQATNKEARLALKAEKKLVCLMVFKVRTWEEACQRMYDYFELGSYEPFELIKTEIEDVCA